MTADPSPEIVNRVIEALDAPERFTSRHVDTARRYFETEQRWRARAVLAALAQSPWDPPEDLADEWRQWAEQTARPF